jgi:hypothetical protein
MKFHSYAEIFPLLEDDEIDALADDIKENGLRHVISLYKGKILDGRNRFLACQKAKVKPHYHKFQGDDDAALTFVVSANIKRRHLTFEQRALAAARIATLRQGDNQHTARAVSQSEAAEKLDVSQDSIQRARKVVERGSKALQQAVESGQVPLRKAASVTGLPKREQLAAATSKPEQKESEPDDPMLSDDWEPDENEEEQLAQAEKDYAASIDKVMAADDKLAAAHTEIKRQAAEIASLKLSRDGFMTAKNAATKMLKSERRKTAKLGKALDKANAQIEEFRERISIMEEAA